MGVLTQSGKWATAKGMDAAATVKTGTLSELQRCQKAIQSLMKVLPSFPCDVVRSAASSVTALLDRIQNLSTVAWSKEKLYRLYVSLIASLESLLSVFSPYVTAPVVFVKDQLVAACVALTSFVYVTFEKIDDTLVTPVYMAGANTTACLYSTAKSTATAQYSLVKNGIVLPTTNLVSKTVVMPCYNVAKGTTSKAISVGAWVDSKLSLVAMMMAVVEKSKKVDECVTKGKIESKLVRPAFELGTSLDDKFLNGTAQTIVTSTITQFPIQST
eukprot:g10950.t1